MVRSGLINPSRRIRVKEARVIDAAGMFIHINPGLSRPGIKEVGRFLDMLVNGIPRPGFGVSVANPNVPGYAANPFTPTPASLCLTDVYVRWTFEDVLVFAHVFSQPRILVLRQEKNVGIVAGSGPIKPTHDPGCEFRVVSCRSTLS